MRRLGVPALRLSLAVIFIWFGLLKPGATASEGQQMVDALIARNLERWVDICRLREEAGGA